MFLKKIPFYQFIIALNKFIFMRFYLLFNLFKIRSFGPCMRVGKHPRLNNKLYLRIARNSSVQIGDNFVLSSGDNLNPLSRNLRSSIATSNNAKIIIGNNVKASSPSIWSHKEIVIGNNVQLGADCIILDSDCHSLDFMDRRNSSIDNLNKLSKPIIIMDDVLIGAKTIILKGVKIGARSVIGAGSVVVKDIPMDCIAAGNPCKVIKNIKKD
ncbi:transferase hexapeptide (six repeat-containing protein) [Polaribacter sp. KT25b]|uniref:acyltransferase n=1 Tax=Polaribacter sp. KT25b TaxID=1855336 RepID=UPI00087CE765|nr:acyltransferase [Polaribacter sp. KT25b]SDS26631.1 transferase hexapeptide (six repeat-containing protein) [Polaribacter sp. KT25b]